VQYCLSHSDSNFGNHIHLDAEDEVMSCMDHAWRMGFANDATVQASSFGHGTLFGVLQLNE